MFRFSQFVTEDEAGAALANDLEVATGELNHVDELFEQDFVRGTAGSLFIRFHPTDKSLANLVAVQGKSTRIIAVLSGDLRPGIIITEYIEQVVQDIPAFVPPKDWGAPIPLDDLFKSGVVKKV
jgi:hypothetical protein